MEFEFDNSGHKKILAECVWELKNWVTNDLRLPIIRYTGVSPAELNELFDRLASIEQLLRKTTDEDQFLPTSTKDDLPIIKCALVHKRKMIAYELQEQLQETYSHELKRLIEEKLKPYTVLVNQKWFKKTEQYELPEMTRYLALRSAEESLGVNFKFKKRIYDEKFQILNAPSLVLSDLNYFRLACGIRNSSVTAAYIDIDKFKDFNMRYGEQTIDRDLLPHFMSVLENHVFSCGYAYRFGGDEYLILLPNMSWLEAAESLSKLQYKLREAEYFGIDERPTVSIGICEVNKYSYLIDSEVIDIAASAKTYAKDNGRDCIAFGNEASKFSIYQPRG